MRPSLLLITLDTTRADHLGSYGHKTARTPNLDALAARGVRFENAWASSPITLSSHATIMTGTFPPRHGARDNGLFKLDPSVETLAEVLKKNGYQTAAFVSASVLDRQFGLNRGFDFYDDNVRVGEQRAFGYQERAANQVTEAVADYLPKLKKNGKPFFLWIHYYDAHFPYVAPNPFKTQFRNSPYDGEIAFIDENIGYLFEELKAAGLDQNLYTVAVADHGEMLGEHGEPNHGVFLYKSAMHVPLIMAGPEINATIASEKVNLAQLAPTLHDLLGIAPQKQAQLTAIDPAHWGRSRNAKTLPINEFHETFMPYFSYGFSPLMGLRKNDFHYIEAPQPELYDLNADPNETRNLLKEPGTDHLKVEWAKKLADAITEYSKGALKSKDRLPLPNANASPELLKSLAQLGYVGNTGGSTENLPDPKDVIDILPKLRRGEELAGQGKFTEAASIYEEVLRRTPGNLNTYGLLAGTRLALKQPEEALRIYRAGLKLNNRLEFLRLGEANALTALKSPEAEVKFRALIKDNPRFADGYMALHDYLLTNGQSVKACVVLTSARGAGHDDAELRYRLAECAYRRKQLAAAVSDYRRAVAFNKYHAEALARLGELSARRAPHDAAGYYRRAIEENPQRQDWRAALAALEGKAGN